jgi:hypothetical protein
MQSRRLTIAGSGALADPEAHTISRLTKSFSGKCSIPLMLERPGAWMATRTKCKLPLANPVRELNIGKRGRGVGKGLEAGHGRATPFDGTMILLHNVVDDDSPRAVC